MAAARRPRVLYRLCLYEDASHCTSFRHGHVTRASHPQVFFYQIPLPCPTRDFYVQVVAVKRTGVLFKVSRKEKGALLCKAIKIKESVFPLPPESAEGFFRHTSFPVLAWGRGEKSFSSRKVFTVKSQAARLSRELLTERERRADWLAMVSHIYLDFLLARSPRWAGCSVREAWSEREEADWPVRFPPLCSVLYGFVWVNPLCGDFLSSAHPYPFVTALAPSPGCFRPRPLWSLPTALREAPN